MLHPNQQQPIFKAKNFLFKVGKNNVLETFFLLPALETFFPILSSINFTFVLLYRVLSCLTLISWRSVVF